jgi:AcrR family transcriptional regulator
MFSTQVIDRGEGRMTQAERTALSDQRMFEAAIELINERGTQKTTLKEIGERAGYSRGLASYRFGSKDGLMLELFERFDELWKQHLQNYITNAGGLKAVQQASNALRDFLKKQSRYLRAMYLLWYESLGYESDMRRMLAEHHDVYRNDAKVWIEQGIATGEIKSTVDATQFAAQYCAFIFGIVYQWVVSSEALDIDAVFDSYIENAFTVLTSTENTTDQ